ncbi:hypothetical protein INR49_030605 [Caranx melampygus]|nr:hypothetical protein INR49_030605 [Caranx melampygus]
MDGGREQERGMLREKDGIFIAAAVFIAAQRRGESGGRGLGCGSSTASRGREGEREAQGGERQLRRQLRSHADEGLWSLQGLGALPVSFVGSPMDQHSYQKPRGFHGHIDPTDIPAECSRSTLMLMRYVQL